jgi:hypothetical protein
MFYLSSRRYNPLPCLLTLKSQQQQFLRNPTKSTFRGEFHPRRAFRGNLISKRGQKNPLQLSSLEDKRLNRNGNASIALSPVGDPRWKHLVTRVCPTRVQDGDVFILVHEVQRPILEYFHAWFVIVRHWRRSSSREFALASPKRP